VYTRAPQVMVVDKFHAKNHKMCVCKTPKGEKKHTWAIKCKGKRNYCGTHCDPRNEPAATLLADQNTESSEQTFRWLSRFKVLLRPMTQGRFNFFFRRMMHRHNMRVVATAKKARLARAFVAESKRLRALGQ